jgi:putative ATPase
MVEVLLGDDKEITVESVDAAMPNKNIFFDKNGNEHFDIAQNYQCAIQDSDANSAIYWLAKWLESGEDPVYIARRILISSSEDACSNPNAAMIANNAYVAAKEIGYPECKIPMAHATIEIANSKRDRSANNAIAMAINDVQNGDNVLAVHANSKDHNTGLGYAKVNKNYIK